jgi:hypothetical protein
MKKDIAQQLNRAAETTPTVFEWELRPEIFTGEELNLTPLGDHVYYIPENEYTVLMPTLVAVDHKQQFKDAYKRGGWEAVKLYHRAVMDKIKTKTVFPQSLN